MRGSASFGFTAAGVLSALASVTRGGGKASRRKQRYEVDRFSDWPVQPKQDTSDDEECLLLMVM